MTGTRPAPGPLGLSVASGSVGAGVVGAVAVGVSALAGGLRGTLSALTGVAVVLLFFVASLWLVEVANRVDPQLTLPAGIAVYSLFLVWLGLLAYGTSLPDRLDRPAFAWTVIAVTLGWLVAQGAAVWRRRIPYVVMDLPTVAPSDDLRSVPVVPVTPMTVRDGRDSAVGPDAGGSAT